MSRLRGAPTPSARTALGAAAVALVAMSAAPAQAASNDNIRITNYDIRYDVGADGGVDVTENLDVRFSDSSHHGLDRIVITGQGVSDTQHREYPMTNVSVSSSTGAPTQLQRSRDGGAERLRIGSPNRTVYGTQHYTLKYHLAGVVNKQSNSSTEFFINATGNDWKIPIDTARVTVKGPGAVSRAKCWYGEKNSKQECRATPGTEASFSANNVGNGRGMTIDADLPTSVFTNTAPILKDGSAEDAFGVNGPLTSSQRQAVNIGGGALAAALAGLGGLWFVRDRRRNADERYSGIAPGQLPAPGQEVPVERTGDPEVAVRFEPPNDATAGLAGLVIDRRADNRDVAGTIVDLAVRGYLRMEQVDKSDWLLISNPQPPAGDLLAYEADLLNALFSDGSQVYLSDLKNHFAGHLANAKEGIEDEAVARGWFKQRPSTSEAGAKGLASLFAVLAVVSFFVANHFHLNGFLFGAGFAIVAVLALVRSKNAAARTPVGSAVYDQTRGFELYLKTAEAKQIKFEEAEQIFSRYMPYAVVLGLADRWAKVFGQVAAAAQAQGYPMVMPYWYVPYGTYQ